jgi:ADP-ribose pyrophosphatase YjhB (NUDIX family)
MTIQQTPFGVFLALTFDAKIYEHYVGLDPTIKNTSFQNLIIALREDGHFGFIGGSANSGESELEALARECKEESNIDTSKLNLTRVCEHVLSDNYIVILYHAQITIEEAKDILRNVVDAEHFFSETAGLNSVVLHTNSGFFKNNFLSCVKKEFVHIAKLIHSDVLERWGKAK